MPTKTIIRVFTRAGDGSLRIRDYPNIEPLLQVRIKIGVDDCSTDMALRGYPVFRGLIGPMPDRKRAVRYESPSVFEWLTQKWSLARPKRKTRHSSPFRKNSSDHSR
jgi:hypothetical protein